MTTRNLIDMLTYCRPSGSKDMRAFGKKFLQPVMGKPDAAGNYFLRVGDLPILFTAHYDTVHRVGGRQTVEIDKRTVRLPRGSKSNCLGADCTTGIWLILQMVAAKVPGSYAIFADEEIGCVGSQDFVRNRFADFEHVSVVLSFDRAGFGSIITHQNGYRTASGEFASSLARVLDMDFRADDGGTFTDSDSFAMDVAECSNLSVGYRDQHTAKESQCLTHAETLAARLICADWLALTVKRQPGELESLPRVGRGWPSRARYDDEAANMADLVAARPEIAAIMLRHAGFTEWDLLDMIERSDEQEADRQRQYRGKPYVDYDPDTGLGLDDILRKGGF